MEGLEQVFGLKCAVQNYAWGRIGRNSEVANLSENADPSFNIKEDAPYAELWMGTHPNGPSKIIVPGKEDTPLADWIQNHQESLGSKVKEVFKSNLPYLFKVLSVNTSLSIQAHPNKEHAEQLHRDRPDIYKDPNHKPEMCIALTPFTGMCGFRLLDEIAVFLTEIIEFRNVVGNDNATELIAVSKTQDPVKKREALKACFNGMMTRDKKVVTEQLTQLVNKVQKLATEGKNTSGYVGDMLLKLSSEFPGDVGCFSIYFLNIVTLQPGEAMFLEANLPHAYLLGDCMECMACSDNVVRAGLTPKFIDVQTLIHMLNYESRSPDKVRFEGVEENGDIKTTVFNPPVPDFCVSKFQVPAGTKSFLLNPINSASVCIVIQGEGQAENSSLSSPLKLRRGSIFFISANQSVDVHVLSDGLLMFRAYCGLL